MKSHRDARMMRRAGIKSDAGIISARGQETACYHGRTKIAPGIVVNPYEIARGNSQFSTDVGVTSRRGGIKSSCRARRALIPAGEKRPAGINEPSDKII